jgi:hypothetical protein
MRPSIALASAALALLAAAQPARAQQLYTGFDVNRLAPTNARAAEQAFLNDLVAHGTETFAGDAWGSPQPLVFGAFGFGAILNPGPSMISDAVGLEGKQGFFSAFEGFDGDARVVVVDGMSVQALGFFATSLNDLGAPPGAPALRLDFFHSGALVYSWLVNNPHTNSDNTMFVGLRGLTFDRVELRGQAASLEDRSIVTDGFWLNDVTIGSSRAVLTTPEPATPLLLGAGLAGLLLAARRSRARARP